MASDPDPAAEVQQRIRAAADQFSAAITEAIHLSMGVTLAKQLQAEQGNEGPWLLYPDGRTEFYG